MDRSELEHEMERLHRESWGWALACCRRDRELAEDTLQTAYLRMLSGKATFSGRSSFKTWVFGVIRLTAIELQRRTTAWHTRLTGEDSASEIPDDTPDVALRAEEAEGRIALTGALRRLAPRQREVLHLVFYHDLTIEEAALVMQVSVGSARTHYDRGKKALARLLAPRAANEHA
jgi:RNA polymerase sigma-70 factor (ECF subfamily)